MYSIWICKSLHPSFWLLRDTCGSYTCIYKHAWASYVHTCTHRRIHGKYSFVPCLVRASCSRINTFHGTGAYRSFIARFLPPFFSFSDVILSFSYRARGSLSSCILYLLRATDAYKSTAWCLSARRVLGVLVNEINDLCESDFGENYMVPRNSYNFTIIYLNVIWQEVIELYISI